MADLSTVYRYRYGVVVWAVLECLLFTAIIYGWASLVFILKEDSFFADLCSVSGSGDPIPANITAAVKEHCAVQDNLLNLAFTIGVFTFTSFGVVAGALLDAYGPRITRLTACATFCLTGLIFGFMNKDRPMLIFPGVIGLTVSGILLFVPSVQISLMFTRWNSLLASLLNGALDSSSIVMLFFKLIYDAGVRLHWIFIGYFIFAVMSIFLFTFVLPAESIRVENLEKILEEKESDSECLIEEESDNESEGSLNELFEQTDPTKDEVEIEKGSFREFWKIVTSPMYLLLVFYLSIHKLRLWFYMGSMDIFLQFASGNNLEAVDAYLDSFGIIQFMGLLFSPIAGLIMAWRPASKENKTFGFIVAICLTNSLNLLLNVTVIVPVIQLQVVSFVVQVLLRGFLYCTYASFILHRFPHDHFGKLYGTGHCIGAIFGTLQFYLFVIVQTRLKGNPFWVNVGFLIFTLILYVFPFYIWVITERETKTKQSHPKHKTQKEK